MRYATFGLLAFALLLPGCGGAKYHLTATPIVPAATGQIDVNRDNNGNTVADLKVEHLAKPSDLTPPKSTYVVWTQAPGATPRNDGQLTVGDNLKGEFKAVTPLRSFELFITAENSPTVSQPSGPEVFRSSIRPS